VLRVLADRRGTPARFLLLGSASPALMKGVTESLAGRVRFIDMGGFDLIEAGLERLHALWLRGGFPRSLLARSEAGSLSWRNDYIRTFLERDIPQLGITVPAQAFRRFWSMIAHFHGQIWNGADFARSLGTSQPTARRYLDILTGAYVVRQLPPWFENIGKRQVRSPKVYVRDSGLLHALLSLRTRRDLMGHPKYGASWEGFAIEQVLSLMRPAESYFWATHSGAELDLLVPQNGRRLGFEMKASDAPTLTKSMAIATEDLGLSRIYVVYPGTRSYRLARSVEVVSIRDLPAALR
jgi:predicted AAA+ superfamily ATPase